MINLIKLSHKLSSPNNYLYQNYDVKKLIPIKTPYENISSKKIEAKS